MSTALVTLIASEPAAYAGKVANELMHVKPQEFQHTANIGYMSTHDRTEQQNNNRSDKPLRQC